MNRVAAQKAQKLRRSYAEVAEVAEETPQLFKNALNQYLCGLQAINGWEGAWELVDWVLFGLRGLRAS